MDKRFVHTVALISVCLLSIPLFLSGSIYAQSSGVIINVDGSITGTDNIQKNGDLYMLTGNISGGLQIQKDGITLDGAGFAIFGNGNGIGINISLNSGDLPVSRSIEALIIKNLVIENFTHGVYISNSGSNIFYGNTITGCQSGFWISGESKNDLLYNNFQDNVDGISFNFASGNNTVSHNNMVNSGITVWQSIQPWVDKNFWNDYIVKYPAATEIGNSGIGNTPYVYSSLNNFTDNNPLIREVSTSNIEFPTLTTPAATVNSTISMPLPTIEPLDQVLIGYFLAAVALLFVGLLFVAFLAFIKRRIKAK